MNYQQLVGHLVISPPHCVEDQKQTRNTDGFVEVKTNKSLYLIARQSNHPVVIMGDSLPLCHDLHYYHACLIGALSGTDHVDWVVCYTR